MPLMGMAAVVVGDRAFNSLFEAELFRHLGPWKRIGDLEFTLVEDIDWNNHRRLHGEIDYIPPSRKSDAPIRT